ncbi:MAG: GTPase ObgE [Clostridia bacterium]|nr:GTPase ObgE [Clostridia bacterium]
MFIDKTKILIKAGNGGDGSVSFRKEKYVPNGGPNGGDGGNGGSIIFEVTPHMNNLSDYHFTKHFRAEDGENGSTNNKYGRYGQDIVIKVPKGTIIKDAQTGKVVADMFFDDDKKVLLKGGKGGRGNAKFATSVRQAPAFSEMGEKAVEKEVILELKTIADIGLIGFPNVGKSTLLSVITSAKPKIANYHFTTISPNLGVAYYHSKSFVVADIPGLIEGASEGVGLGHAFLRHIERTRMLVHVIDIAAVDGRNPLEDFKIINNELKSYSKKLASLLQIVVLNKMDLLFDDFSKLEEFKKKYGKKYKIIEVSAATHTGLDELLDTIIKNLETLPTSEPDEVETFDFDVKDKTFFEVNIDEDGVFVVSGGLIDEMIRGIVLTDTQSFAYFQKRLKQDGIIKRLKEMGIQENDLVRIGYVEFEYSD